MEVDKLKFTLFHNINLIQNKIFVELNTNLLNTFIPKFCTMIFLLEIK